jgi:integrase
VQAKRQERANAKTFAEACEEWIDTRKAQWRSVRHAKNLLGIHGKPLADKPVSAITTPMVKDALKDFWKQYPEQARRALSMWARVFDYAKAMKYRSGDNPAAWRGNMEYLFPHRPKNRHKHYRSLPFERVPELVSRLRLRQVKGTSAVALEFVILTAARPDEVLGMPWAEVDLKNAIWTIPPERTKQKRQHRVPLPAPCMRILALQNEYRVGEFVFTGYKRVELDPKSMRGLLRKMGVPVTPHGFRSSFRNWCARTGQLRELAELSLAHEVKSKVEAAYWRDDALDERRPIMDAWAEYCESAMHPHAMTTIQIDYEKYRWELIREWPEGEDAQRGPVPVDGDTTQPWFDVRDPEFHRPGQLVRISDPGEFSTRKGSKKG